MKFWQKVIHGTSALVDMLTVLFFMPVLLYGVYAIWDSGQIYHQADASLYENYKPTQEQSLSFEELKQINSEVIGWLTIPGTQIDYPLVQGEYNSKYVNTDVKGNFSLSGSIFLDCRNHADFSDLNNVIYGHHMEKQEMFGELEKFAQQTFFQEHPYGLLYHDEKWYSVSFFAFIPADAYDPILFDAQLEGAQDGQAYLDYIQEHAQNYSGCIGDETDSYLTLSTCADTTTNGRYLLIGQISAEPELDGKGDGKER